VYFADSTVTLVGFGDCKTISVPPADNCCTKNDAGAGAFHSICSGWSLPVRTSYPGYPISLPGSRTYKKASFRNLEVEAVTTYSGDDLVNLISAGITTDATQG